MHFCPPEEGRAEVAEKVFSQRGGVNAIARKRPEMEKGGEP